ncbi:MAG: endonuclease [Gammaproteobacteria bacterium]|nr:endonuclease [Gammaproteobacteria bacterium]
MDESGLRQVFADKLVVCFSELGRYYGTQHWWPANTPFEMAVGAVLTQHTSWSNAEKALQCLKIAQVLEPARLAQLPLVELQSLVRGSGTYRLKAVRLRALARWWLDRSEHHQDSGFTGLRTELLAVNGIGPETADCIALYAFARPRFVADAYARRLLTRLGITPGDFDYERTRCLVEEVVPADTGYLGEAHALIVTHAKVHCTVRPLCDGCPLAACCERIGVAC